MLLRVCGWLLCSTINYAGSSWYSWWRPLWTSVSNNSLLRFLFEFKIASFAQDCQHTHSLHPSLAWPLEESVWENPWELGINGRITWLLVTQALESDHLSLSPGAPLLLCDLWWVFKPPLSLSYLICKGGWLSRLSRLLYKWGQVCEALGWYQDHWSPYPCSVPYALAEIAASRSSRAVTMTLLMPFP